MSDLTSRASGNLVSLEEIGGSGKYADVKAFDVVASGSSFLPRVQLYGSNSGPAKRGKIGMGHWGLVRNKDQIEDLGTSCSALVLSWRPKALRIDGDEVVSVFNPESRLFQEIQSTADSPDSGCLFGQMAA